MAAPKGNRNGEKTWFEPIADEPTIRVQSRIPVSQREAIDELLKEGETLAQFFREAIAAEIEKRSLPPGG